MVQICLLQEDKEGFLSQVLIKVAVKMDNGHERVNRVKRKISNETLFNIITKTIDFLKRIDLIYISGYDIFKDIDLETRKT